MPTAIASGHSTVFHYRGNVTPPRDWNDWSALVRRLAGSAIARYGLPEVEQWFFEVWNEPTLHSFWRGTRAQFFQLYRGAARALKELSPELRVGGPATVHNAWIDEFLDECERTRTPVDFVSTHHYPTDTTVNRSDNVDIQLALMHRDILREEAQDTCRRARGKPLFYAEWHTSADGHDPRHDDPYAAAFIIKTVPRRCKRRRSSGSTTRMRMRSSAGSRWAHRSIYVRPRLVSSMQPPYSAPSHMT